MNASLELQRVIIAALQGGATDAGSRVYDNVPPDVVFPYIALTGWQEIQVDTDCLTLDEIFFDVQCYSLSAIPGRVEAATLAAQVKAALHNVDLVIAGFCTVTPEYRSTLYFVEPDGLTRRAVVNFKALVDAE